MRAGSRIALLLISAALVVPVAASGARKARHPVAHAAASASSATAGGRSSKSRAGSVSSASGSAAPEAASSAAAKREPATRAAAAGTPARGHGGKRKRAKPRRRWRPQVTRGYQKMVQAWHQPMQTPAPVDERGRPNLVLEILNTGEKIAVPVHRADGGFRAYDADRLAYRLRDTRTNNELPIDPELLDLVYQIQTHFKSEAIRVISGYRTRKATGQSNHGRGRAIDIVVPGAKDDEVAEFVRTRGFVGVGLYPTSGFVHVDVRPESYYWIDRSGPGQRNREQATLKHEASANDARATAAGRKPHRRWSEPSNDVAGVWGGEAVAPTAPTDVDDQEDDLDEDP